jgi:hypothetical protein
MEYENRKKDHENLIHQQKEVMEARKWELKKEKAKEKHRGR